MNYKETLFFIGKCLTISLELKNRLEIEQSLKLDDINWDNIVKISTEHYVFPALYCNLKRAGFLHYLPTDLVEYMKYITELNRDRNLQIIEQAKELNTLLLANNITPIFLKGTGNLLEGLYEDIAERMVGDIDFIIAKDNYIETIKILKNFEYSEVDKATYYSPFFFFKHYPRLIKKNKIAAVEIHKELIIKKYANEFNYNVIKKDIITADDIHVMSYDNQVALTIIAKQINDDGIYYKNIALRNAYDVFLLSKKKGTINFLHKFNTLYHPLNCYLAICYEVFHKIESLKYTKSPETESYLTFINKSLRNAKYRQKHEKKTKRYLFFKSRLSTVYKSIFKKEYRNWLIKRVTDKEWHQQKLIQLGLKKSKPNASLP